MNFRAFFRLLKKPSVPFSKVEVYFHIQHHRLLAFDESLLEWLCFVFHALSSLYVSFYIMPLNRHRSVIADFIVFG